jgi:hypothetical protein
MISLVWTSISEHLEDLPDIRPVHPSTLRHLRNSHHEVRHYGGEQNCAQDGWAVLVVIHALGAAFAQMLRAIHENAGRVNDREQRGEREHHRADKPAFVLWRNEI